MIEVITPGLLSTLQDLGRLNQSHLGVSCAGAVDKLSLQLGNLLLGNPPIAVALELTLLLPVKLSFHKGAWIAVTGALCNLLVTGRSLPMGTQCWIDAGETIEILPKKNQGIYVYLAVLGGIQVEQILGACSTDLKNSLGGLHGNGEPLRKGDQLLINDSSRWMLTGRSIPLYVKNSVIFALKGPEYHHFSTETQERFWRQDWRIGFDSNRIGIRLKGEALRRLEEREMLSQGSYSGIIQVPINGEPIILSAEAGAQGGYPRIAVIPEAELWKLGRINLGETIRFSPITLAEARVRLEQQIAYLKMVKASANQSKEEKI